MKSSGDGSFEAPFSILIFFNSSARCKIKFSISSDAFCGFDDSLDLLCRLLCVFVSGLDSIRSTVLRR